MSEAVERLSAALADRYRIERELGEGGMATVYLAEDLKHDRKVAIKVLRPELAAVLGAERFVQEIKTTAALQHPHILPLFDSGEAGGFLYYVMPYIQGETIREKLDRETQFGIEEAVRITTEVADALHYAHENGVIHRDIKPENILLHNGRPMVMDFGIALAVSAAAGGRMTETGLSLGTPHYMSPEQATADKNITAYSDVYSLASVLYEMLTGQPPHTGGSAQQIIMKIVTEDAAPVTRMRKSVPPNVAAAVAKALEKLPADRFESAQTFAEALRNAGFTTAALAPGAAAPADARAIRWWIRSPWSWALMVVVTAALGWSVTRPEPARPVTRIETTSFPAATFGFELSRDGRRLVTTVHDSLWIRDLDDLAERMIPLQGNAPALSADGGIVAFTRTGTNRTSSLYVAPTEGGSATLIADSVPFAGHRWGPDGYLYFVRNGTLGRVRGTGGPVEPLAELRIEPVLGATQLYDVLPGSKAAIVRAVWTDSSTTADGRPLVGVRVVTFDGREPRSLGLLGLGWGEARVLPGGYLALIQAGPEGSRRQMVARFDLKALRVVGDPVLLLDNVRSVAWSDDGTAVYRLDPMAQRGLYGARGGDVRPAVGRDGEFWYGPRVSPNGRRIAWVRSAQGEFADNIWLQEGIPGTFRPLTYATDSTSRDVVGWSPDGTRVYFDEPPPDHSTLTLMVVNAENGSAPDTAFSHATHTHELSMTPDGRTVLWVPLSGSAIWQGTIGSTEATELLRVPRGEVGKPAVSPDGRWIAYVSTETGEAEVYVQAFPQGGRKLQVTTGGTLGEVIPALAVFWSRSGRSLFIGTRGPPADLVEARLDLVAGRVVEQTSMLRTESRVTWAGILPGDSVFVGSTFDLLPGESPRVVVALGMLTEIRRRLEGAR